MSQRSLSAHNVTQNYIVGADAGDVRVILRDDSKKILFSGKCRGSGARPDARSICRQSACFAVLTSMSPTSKLGGSSKDAFLEIEDFKKRRLDREFRLLAHRTRIQDYATGKDLAPKFDQEHLDACFYFLSLFELCLSGTSMSMKDLVQTKKDSTDQLSILTTNALLTRITLVHLGMGLMRDAIDLVDLKEMNHFYKVVSLEDVQDIVKRADKAEAYEAWEKLYPLMQVFGSSDSRRPGNASHGGFLLLMHYGIDHVIPQRQRRIMRHTQWISGRSIECSIHLDRYLSSFMTQTWWESKGNKVIAPHKEPERV